MGTVLGYILALLVVGGVLFLAASYAFGRGEEMAPALPEGTPLELPDDRLARGDDLRALKLSVALRGYRMDEVDWLLEQLADQVETRDREIARLRSVLHVEPVDPPSEPELLTHAPDNGWGPGPENGRPAGSEGRRTDAPAPDSGDRGPEPDNGRLSSGDADRAAGARSGRPAEAEGGRADGGDDWGSGDGARPYPVPEGTGDTGARPDRPVRDVRTAGPSEGE